MRLLRLILFIIVIFLKSPFCFAIKIDGYDVEFYKIADGNITAFVYDCNNKKDRTKIISTVIQKPYMAEQVGFVAKILPEVPKLEMAGGEFCGDATIAYASLLSITTEGDKKKYGKFYISGYDLPVSYENLFDGKANVIKSLTRFDKFKYKFDTEKSIVLFDGIGYILKNGTSDEQSFTKEEIASLAKKYNLPVFGGIVFNNKTNQMLPTVYVRDIDSYLKETACGSGSMAIRVRFGVSKIKQRSGEYINVGKYNDIDTSATFTLEAIAERVLYEKRL